MNFALVNAFARGRSAPSEEQRAKEPSIRRTSHSVNEDSGYGRATQCAAARTWHRERLSFEAQFKHSREAAQVLFQSRGSACGAYDEHCDVCSSAIASAEALLGRRMAINDRSVARRPHSFLYSATGNRAPDFTREGIRAKVCW